MVILVRPDEIQSVWVEVWLKISGAVELESEDDIRADLEAGNRYLLLAGDGAAIVRGCGDFLEINYVGGTRIREWKDTMNAAIEAIARSEGCQKIVAFGRKGWGRIWPQYRDTQQHMFVREL